MSEREASIFRCRRCGAASSPREGRWRCVCGAEATCSAGIWRFDSFEPAGFTSASRQHLSGFEEDHFWFEGRERLLLGLLDRRRLRPPRAIDLGCGNGRFLAALAALGVRCVGVDAYGDSLERAARKAPRALLLQADIVDVPLPPAACDLVVALDVLEHLEPARLLGEAARLLAVGGHLLLSVPAFPSLWSERDRRAGHRKRYRRHDLESELAASGFAVVASTHYQFLLFPLVWLSRVLDARRDEPLERRPPRALGRLLGTVNRIEIALWGRRSLPWGSSLLALAQRREEAAP